MTLTRDPGLDTLLDLHGQMLFVDDGALGEIHCGAEVTAERPHGLSYSLTLHGWTVKGWSVSTMRTW